MTDTLRRVLPLTDYWLQTGASCPEQLPTWCAVKAGGSDHPSCPEQVALPTMKVVPLEPRTWANILNLKTVDPLEPRTWVNILLGTSRLNEMLESTLTEEEKKKTETQGKGAT
jgi:hypothetical protein